MGKTRSSNERRRTGFSMAAWAGAILILLGLVFFLQKAGMLGETFHWWALFILAPAIGLLGGAWAVWQHSGSRYHPVVRLGLGSGAIVLTVALMFLFDLSWVVWWPLMLIVPGLVILGNGFTDPRARRGAFLAGLTNMGLWTGSAVAALGLAFLLGNFRWISLPATFGPFHWWGIAILVPGLGALYNALVAFRHGGYTFLAESFLLAGLAVCTVATVALLSLDWNLLTPIILIVTGVALLGRFLGKQPQVITG